MFTLQNLRSGLVFLMLTACSASLTVAPPAYSQGFGERLGAQLDRGIDRLSEEFKEGWDSLRKAVDKMGVQGRVYSRLRWDKALAQSAIDVDVEDDSSVVLRGRVDTVETRNRAVQLAEDTVGVEQVLDQLTVQAVAEGRGTDPSR